MTREECCIEKLESILPLEGKRVLEIGCGAGTLSVLIARSCKHMIALDPDASLISSARRRAARANITYHVGQADALPFEPASFDIVIFSLSLHHIPRSGLDSALEEARRVTKGNGHVVVIEPGFRGSLFEAELQFGAFDGDERKQKNTANAAVLKHASLQKIQEALCESLFTFRSVRDFTIHGHPTKRAHLRAFLERYRYELTAERRISVFGIA